MNSMLPAPTTTFGRQYSWPIVGALAIHAVVVVLIFSSWNFSLRSHKEFEIPDHIVASVVTIEQPEVEPKPVVQPKVTPAPKPEPVVKEPPKPVIKQEPKPEPVVEQPKPKPETVPQPVEEVKQPETVVPKAETPEVTEPEVAEPELANEEDLFNDLLQGLAAEEASINEQIEIIESNQARQAEIDATVTSHKAMITRQIEEQWSRPTELRLMSSLQGIEAVVSVELLPTGELLNASITKASGNQRFDDSVLRAVERVRRFSVPENSEAFEQGGFRRLNITFRPEDLMSL